MTTCIAKWEYPQITLHFSILVDHQHGIYTVGNCYDIRGS